MNDDAEIRALSAAPNPTFEITGSRGGYQVVEGAREAYAVPSYHKGKKKISIDAVTYPDRHRRLLADRVVLRDPNPHGNPQRDPIFPHWDDLEEEYRKVGHEAFVQRHVNLMANDVAYQNKLVNLMAANDPNSEWALFRDELREVGTIGGESIDIGRIADSLAYYVLQGLARRENHEPYPPWALISRKRDSYVPAVAGAFKNALEHAKVKAVRDNAVVEIWETSPDPSRYRRMGWLVRKVALVRPHGGYEMLVRGVNPPMLILGNPDPNPFVGTPIPGLLGNPDLPDDLRQAVEAVMRWKGNWAAAPYAQAILRMDFGVDDPHGVLLYLKSNLRTWKGEEAKAAKVVIDKYIKAKWPRGGNPLTGKEQWDVRNRGIHYEKSMAALTRRGRADTYEGGYAQGSADSFFEVAHDYGERGGNPMKLLTKADIAKLPKIGAQEKLGMEAIAYVKFFTPWTNWTWYATEFDGQDTFFGLVQGFEEELGYFSLSELQSIRGPGGLRIERDLYFKPTPLSQIRRKNPFILGRADYGPYEVLGKFGSRHVSNIKRMNTLALKRAHQRWPHARELHTMFREGPSPESPGVEWFVRRKRNPEEDYDEPLSCSVCGGALMIIGELGPLTWYRCRHCGMEASVGPGGASFGENPRRRGPRNPWAICTAAVGRKDKARYERCVRKVKRKMRGGNPDFAGLPPHVANDPRFRAELRAYRRRHGSGPVEVREVQVPDGFPRYMSAWGHSPQVLYDAPGHSNKGKRIHRFGEGEGRGEKPFLVSSVERGKKFLAYAGGKFRADGTWITG